MRSLYMHLYLSWRSIVVDDFETVVWILHVKFAQAFTSMMKEYNNIPHCFGLQQGFLFLWSAIVFEPLVSR